MTQNKKQMKVAILFSGGKDSAYALGYALEKGWKIEYLLTVIPTRKDCYLFHYATTQQAGEIAKMLGIRHIAVRCDFANPNKEALLIKDIVESNKVDALILGGVGLQRTQIKSLKNALMPIGVEVFVSHDGYTHEEVIKDMLNKGYKFVITQIASDGLAEWLGKEITKENFPQLKRDSEKFGFHIGFEGGYADTFCLDAPYFPKRIELVESEKVFDDDYSGHLIIKAIRLVDKEKVKRRH